MQRPAALLPSSCIHRLVGADAGRVGAGESAPEKIEKVRLPARGVEGLARDVAAAVVADLPAPPRHRSAVLVRCELLHSTLCNTDVVNIHREQPHLFLTFLILTYLLTTTRCTHDPIT